LYLTSYQRGAAPAVPPERNASATDSLP
jgi:hypothetical protein